MVTQPATFVSVLSLCEHHVRIIRALQAAVRILHADGQLTIVGGMAKYLVGKAHRVGDVDILVGKDLCKRYWEFIEILSYHGIVSQFDVLEQPKYPWHFCRPEIGHGRALTADWDDTSQGFTHANLDICFKADDLSEIPGGDKWFDAVRLLQWKTMSQQDRDSHLAAACPKFKQARKGEEVVLVNERLHPDLNKVAWQ